MSSVNPSTGHATGQFTSTEVDTLAALNSLEPTPPGYMLVKTKDGFANVPVPK